MRLLTLWLAFLVGSQSAPDRPNIIHIVGDDVGYDDLGCFGSPDIATPHLDRLASEGMRFTSFYAPSATCTPTRAAILTGRHAARVDGCANVLFPTDRKGLEAGKELTIARLLKDQGYATALVGKWHLGHLPEYLPPRHGFDLYLGIPYPNDHGPERLGGTGSRGFPPIPLIHQTRAIEQPAPLPALPVRFADEAVRFITEHKDRPFFLHLSNIETHTPWFVPPEFKGRSKAGPFGDAVECMDWMVGQVVETLKRLGLERKTLVVFSSDNGPLVQRYEELEKCYGAYARVDAARKHLLRDGKYQARYEGGTRVACVMRWPGVIPAGASCDEIAAGYDLFATFAEIGGAKVPADRIIDGKNILPLMKGQPGARSPHAAFYGIAGSRVHSVREGKWKLVLPLGRGSKELFDLSKDPGETTDLNHDDTDEIVHRLILLAERAQAAIQNNQPFPKP